MPPGERIVSEGEGGVGFFFVETGSVAVTLDRQRRATLGPGDHFGEIALLAGADRTATVSAERTSSAGACPPGTSGRSCASSRA